MQRLVKLVRAVSPPLECGAVRLTWHKTPSQVGSSKRLYASFVSLCRQHYGQEGLVAACSLRSQVLLALHETKPGQPGGAPSDVSTFDRCFDAEDNVPFTDKLAYPPLTLQPILCVK